MEEKHMEKLLYLLNDNILNMKNIHKEIKELNSFYELKNYSYLNDLLEPETRRNVRVPSKTPIPTATFQLKSYTNINTGLYGNFLMKINPFFLIENGYFNKTLSYRYKVANIWQNATRYLKVISPSAIWNSTSDMYKEMLDLQQVVEKGIYDQYRLVSASVKLIYIGPIEEVKGVIGGGISNKEYKRIGIRGTYNMPTSNQYNSNFEDISESMEEIRHMVYNREVFALNGIRMLYFPVDKSFLDFYKVGKYTDFKWNKKSTSQAHPDFDYNVPVCSTFNWFLYGENLPIEKTCFRLELCCNFECIPNQEVLNYIPIELSVFHYTEEEMIEIFKKIHKYAINKLK